ncbi:MAG: CHAT domain-containing protein [Patescibacteria group bacterium]
MKLNIGLLLLIIIGCAPIALLWWFVRGYIAPNAPFPSFLIVLAGSWLGFEFLLAVYAGGANAKRLRVKIDKSDLKTAAKRFGLTALVWGLITGAGALLPLSLLLILAIVLPFIKWEQGEKFLRLEQQGGKILPKAFEWLLHTAVFVTLLAPLTILVFATSPFTIHSQTSVSPLLLAIGLLVVMTLPFYFFVLHRSVVAVWHNPIYIPSGVEDELIPMRLLGVVNAMIREDCAKPSVMLVRQLERMLAYAVVDTAMRPLSNRRSCLRHRNDLSPAHLECSSALSRAILESSKKANADLLDLCLRMGERKDDAIEVAVFLVPGFFDFFVAQRSEEAHDWIERRTGVATHPLEQMRFGCLLVRVWRSEGQMEEQLEAIYQTVGQFRKRAGDLSQLVYAFGDSAAAVGTETRSDVVKTLGSHTASVAARYAIALTTEFDATIRLVEAHADFSLQAELKRRQGGIRTILEDIIRFGDSRVRHEADFVARVSVLAKALLDYQETDKSEPKIELKRHSLICELVDLWIEFDLLFLFARVEVELPDLVTKALCEWVVYFPIPRTMGRTLKISLIVLRKWSTEIKNEPMATALAREEARTLLTASDYEPVALGLIELLNKRCPAKTLRQMLILWTARAFGKAEYFRSYKQASPTDVLPVWHAFPEVTLLTLEIARELLLTSMPEEARRFDRLSAQLAFDLKQQDAIDLAQFRETPPTADTTGAHEEMSLTVMVERARQSEQRFANCMREGRPYAGLATLMGNDQFEDLASLLPQDTIFVANVCLPEEIHTFHLGNDFFDSDLCSIQRGFFNELLLNWRLALEHDRVTSEMEDEMRAFSEEIFLGRAEGQCLYYLGLGPFARLPIAKLLALRGDGWDEIPVVRLYASPRFESPSVGNVSGKALWCEKAPRPLLHVRQECESLAFFDAEEATIARVCEAFEQAAPAHIACHAEATRFARGVSRMQLADGWLSESDIPDHLASPLVFLCACDTSLGSLIPGVQKESLALTLLRRGVGAVVSTQWTVRDDVAPIVSRVFWEQIQKGENPPRALWLAQKEIQHLSTHFAAFELSYG